MANTWEAIRLWSKIIFFSAIALFVIVLVSLNWNVKVYPVLDLVFAKWQEPRLLIVLLFTAAASIFGWWLFWAVWRAMRQIRHSRQAGKTARLEREVADMKAKAAMLQSKPERLE